MRDFLETLDGSGKSPRPIQIDWLKHFRSQLSRTRIHTLNAPPGIGKSFLARTLQRSFPSCAILSPNNLLVDQYCATYSELNAVKGEDNYETPDAYTRSRNLAETSANVFNPLSYYYFYLSRPHLDKPSVVIIDEAHKLGEMLLMTITQALSVEYYNIPEDLSDVEFAAWLDKITSKLETFSEATTGPRARFGKIYRRLKIVNEYLKENLHKVKISYEMRTPFTGKKRFGDRKPEPALHLIIQPLVVPVELMDTIFGPRTRIVLFSGSITDFHVKELFPKETAIDFIQYEPLAPIENRPIFYKPVTWADRKNPKVLADSIRKIYEEQGRPNTLVHLTYSMAKEVGPLLFDLRPLTHTKESKTDTLATFKKRGGILLASGMAEGVDLPGDLCRLIIIPNLLWPNKGDQAVEKRLALPNGQFWYSLETVMTFVQQVGRGVRGETDACTTFILDPTFKGLINKEPIKARLTKGFLNSIHWS